MKGNTELRSDNILRDEVTQIRDPVHGYIYANELECKIIDSPVFQRLRGIRQLASAHLTYQERFIQDLNIVLDPCI